MEGCETPKHLPYLVTPSIIDDMNQVLHLFQLQKIDTQLDRNSNRLREIVAILQNDQSVQEAENKLKKARQEHFQAHQALHIAEDEVLNQRIKIETSEICAL